MRIRNFEKKVYEKIGIKKAKMVLCGRNPGTNPKNVKMGKYSNQRIYEISSRGIKNFRKKLIFNGLVHLLCFMLDTFMIFIYSVIFLPIVPIIIPRCIAHFYFVVLQRYNWIRTSEALEKYNDLQKKREQNAKNNHQVEQTKEIQLEQLSLETDEVKNIEEIKRNLEIIREKLLSCKVDRDEFGEMVDSDLIGEEVEETELSLILQKDKILKEG